MNIQVSNIRASSFELLRVISECLVCIFLVFLSYILGIGISMYLILPIFFYMRLIKILERHEGLIGDVSSSKELEMIFFKPYVINFLVLIFLPLITPYLFFLYFSTSTLALSTSDFILSNNAYLLDIYTKHPVFLSLSKFHEFAKEQAQLIIILHVNIAITFYFGSILGFVSLLNRRVRKSVLLWAKYFSTSSGIKRRSFFGIILFSLFYPMLFLLPLIFPMRTISDFTVFSGAYLLGSSAVYAVIFFIAIAYKSEES